MSVTPSSASLFLWMYQIFLSLLHSCGSKCKRYKRLYGEKFLPESPRPPDLFSEATSISSVLRNPRDVFMGCVLCVCVRARTRVHTHSHTHACTPTGIRAEDDRVTHVYLLNHPFPEGNLGGLQCRAVTGSAAVDRQPCHTWGPSGVNMKNSSRIALVQILMLGR